MSMLSQVFPPSPTFTEKELPDLQGKVCIVTGAAQGVTVPYLGDARSVGGGRAVEMRNRRRKRLRWRTRAASVKRGGSAIYWLLEQCQAAGLMWFVGLVGLAGDTREQARRWRCWGGNGPAGIRRAEKKLNKQNAERAKKRAEKKGKAQTMRQAAAGGWSRIDGKPKGKDEF
ncbi:hypothetical protein NLG97_g9493 [Lecanicillium saksenae]|uniref:Uncharacterized protein n=1 Tax=Lecanicillium saksenae TaxID=468837 RepID=A0ACC1QH64_9HYPO|nr:hypothetical protein NLG97_g9493 [Lecanicillium saksenae]